VYVQDDQQGSDNIVQIADVDADIHYGLNRPYEYRQRYNPNDDFTDNKANSGVQVGDLHMAMMSLPDVMAAVA